MYNYIYIFIYIYSESFHDGQIMMITPENEKVKASRILSDSSRFPGAGLGDGLRFGFSTVSFISHSTILVG